MADIASTLAGWLSTTASNAPSGATTIGTGLDDNLRELQGVVVRGLSHKGADIASATTTDIGAVEGLAHDITGVTTITGLGTVRSGIWKILKFEGILTLTHNATSLILPGGQSITTADGDSAIVISEGSGNWRCVNYTRATGDNYFKVGSFTFDTAAASGTTAVSGVGFKPKMVRFRAVLVGGLRMSEGADDGTTANCIYDDSNTSPDTWGSSATASIFLIGGVGTSSSALISSLDSDGFTITRTKTGSPTGTATVLYEAYR